MAGRCRLRDSSLAARRQARTFLRPARQRDHDQLVDGGTCGWHRSGDRRSARTLSAHSVSAPGNPHPTTRPYPDCARCGGFPFSLGLTRASEAPRHPRAKSSRWSCSPCSYGSRSSRSASPADDVGPRRGHQTHRDGPRSRTQLSAESASVDGIVSVVSRPVWVRGRTSNLCAEVRLLPGPLSAPAGLLREFARLPADRGAVAGRRGGLS